MSSSTCSALKSPRIQIPLSTPKFSHKSQLPRVQVYGNKNRIGFSFHSRSRFRVKQCIQKEKESNYFSQENIVEASSSKNNDDNLGISGSPPASFLSFLCPLLKLFSGGDPSRERNYSLEEATSSLSTFARLPWGSRSLFGNSQRADGVDPPMRLQLFEFEACPFCRRVREAMTELDLSVEIYPCPKGSVRHREMVRKFGGKEQFPFLVDPNTGISLYESSEIVKYLFQQYGKGRNPSVGLLESTIVTGWMPTLLRAGRGMTIWEKSKKDTPTRKLELFSYENSAYARIVREALCELELPYILQNVGEGSARAPLLLEISGSNEVPYLVDPNTGQQIGDYKRIISYLFETYCMVSV